MNLLIEWFYPVVSFFINSINENVMSQDGVRIVCLDDMMILADEWYVFYVWILNWPVKTPMI